MHCFVYPSLFLDQSIVLHCCGQVVDKRYHDVRREIAISNNKTPTCDFCRRPNPGSVKDEVIQRICLSILSSDSSMLMVELDPHDDRVVTARLAQHDVQDLAGHFINSRTDTSFNDPYICTTEKRVGKCQFTPGHVYDKDEIPATSRGEIAIEHKLFKELVEYYKEAVS